MKLISVDEFARRYFDATCRPDSRTIRTWVMEGYIPGRVIGPRRCYIDEDAFLKSQIQTGDALADRVLEGSR